MKITELIQVIADAKKELIQSFLKDYNEERDFLSELCIRLDIAWEIKYSHVFFEGRKVPVGIIKKKDGLVFIAGEEQNETVYIILTESYQKNKNCN
jgi:hypothetical protein